MSTTAHSEYLPLVSVLLNPVRHAIVSREKLQAEWEGLNYTSLPHYADALLEYEAFEALFRDKGIAIDYLPPSATTTIDALYCRDASVVTDHGVVLCNMGKLKRGDEPGHHKEFYTSRGIPILGGITAPGTLEGGDLAWLDRDTLAVGHSYRTNEAGIEQLRELMRPYNIRLIVADLPHYKGPEDVFHLMSVLSPIGKKTAVIYPPLLPIRFRNALVERGYQFIEVPEAEFYSLGCNVLALSPNCCMMVSGNPETKEALEQLGWEVLVYKGNEISLKGGGGPTCLTRPLKRQL